MVSSTLPQNFARILCFGNHRFIAFSTRTLKSAAFRTAVDKPAPWPYQEKGYAPRHTAMDDTTPRLDESSKFIVVEGNTGSGKSKFARELAKRFDFHFIPEPTMDVALVNRYGTDMRKLYDKLPTRFQWFDVKMFYENPTHINVAQFQKMMYMLKAEAYFNAMAHILNTGQGVVMERSPWSDTVFVDALCRMRVSHGNEEVPVLSNDYRMWYEDMRWTMDPFHLFWPHLVIYLDCPHQICYENVKKRAIPHEVNSVLFRSPLYLELMERAYKVLILPRFHEYSQLLIYDWREPGDIDLVVEDIERLDLGDEWTHHKGERFEMWHLPDNEFEWNRWRYRFTNKKVLERMESVPPIRCGELNFHPEDRWAAKNVLMKYYGGKYAVGFNLDRGDSLWKILFNMTPSSDTDRPWEPYFWTNQWMTRAFGGVQLGETEPIINQV